MNHDLYTQKRDEIVLKLAHTASLIPRGKTMSAATFPESQQAIDSLFLELLGEDQSTVFSITKGDDPLLTQHRYEVASANSVRNELRAEQRAIVKGQSSRVFHDTFSPTPRSSKVKHHQEVPYLDPEEK